jgi:hypothetical protein
MYRSDWSSDFVYAKSLLFMQPCASSRTPKSSSKRSEDWFLKSIRGLGTRSFSGSLGPKDKEELHRRLAAAGREFNKGHISEDEYHKYVNALLQKKCGKENSDSTQFLRLRPHSAPHSCHVPAPKQQDEFARPMLTKTLPRRAPIYDESKYQKSVRVRSARERSRALAWMQKVAHREEDVDYSYQPVCDRIQGPAAREVLVKGAPRGTNEAAIKELLQGFGAISAIEAGKISLGERTFTVRFHCPDHAQRAAHANKCTLFTSVLVSPIPRDSDTTTLRRICSRWGKVLSATEVCDTSALYRSAIVSFESKVAAEQAIGEHIIEASSELRITGIPPDAKEDHIRGALGGVRGGVTNVSFYPNFNSTSRSAVVAFASVQLARRAAGVRELAITGRGGAISALSKAQANAHKGHAAPWHSTLKERPFANYEMHSYQFGHQPCTTREFKKRAAGTYGVENRNKDLAGSSMRYTTRRVKVKAEVCTTTLSVSAYPCTVTVTLSKTSK